jgi:hypothetical protein
MIAPAKASVCLCNCVAQQRHVTNPAAEVQRVSEEREANRTGKVLSESCSNHQGQASGVGMRATHSLSVSQVGTHLVDCSSLNREYRWLLRSGNSAGSTDKCS